MNTNILKMSLASYILAFSQGLWAANFVIKDIQVQGLQRVSVGTVLNYLPVKRGDSFAHSQSNHIIRSLYQTGLFKDIKLVQQNNVLVVKVLERPAIGEINFSGNHAFKTKQLLTVLKKANISKGRTLDRSALIRLQRGLKEQYLAKSKYSVEINTQIEALPRNRVAINIQISEGSDSRIRQVKIIGNKAFPEHILLKQIQLGPKGTFALFGNKDKYAKEKLVADLDSLVSFYRDRGYLKFEITSTQVELSPNKKNVYIIVNIHEGDQYKVKFVDIASDAKIPVSELKAMLSIKKGQVYSQKLLEKTQKNIANKLGTRGYAFSKIKSLPEIDEINKTVSIMFVAESGNRTYVRRINIRGNHRSQDQVFRREMRQLESSFFSRTKVERSKIRLQRLSYVENVKIEVTPVAGTKDQVDLNVIITERMSNQFRIGAGYSQSQGMLFNIGLQQNNFMGTGKRVDISADNSKSVKNYRFGYINPYHTINGVSRGFTAYYNQTDAAKEDISKYLSNRYGGVINYSIPLSEYSSANLGIGAEKHEIKTGNDAPTHIKSFLNQHGKAYKELLGNASVAYDTRDKTVFPTKGQRHSIGLEAGLPSSDLEYYKVRYNGSVYYPLNENFVAAAKTVVAGGKGRGKLSGLPFFERFHAGGIHSVRGFDYNSLGPLDSNNDAKGGNILTTATAEVSFPAPLLSDLKTLRMSAFVDAGQVFNSKVSASDLRYSAGIGATWLSPIGPLTLSYAKPLNKKEGDDEQNLQFTIGTSF